MLFAINIAIIHFLGTGDGHLGLAILRSLYLYSNCYPYQNNSFL